MAQVWLDRYECDRDGKLPPVCMVCGAEADHSVKRTFSWYPPWVIVTILVALIVYVILALVLTKKMTVYVPLCSEHKNHFSRRVMFGGLLIAAAFVVLIGAFAVGVILAEQKVNDTLAMLAFIGSPVGFLIVLIVASIVMRRGINPTEITDDDIKLKGVSDEFVDALKVERRAKKEARDKRRAERDDEDDRRRRQRRRDDYDDEDDDYEDRRPRGRSRADDDY